MVFRKDQHSNNSIKYSSLYDYTGITPTKKLFSQGAKDFME